MSKNQKRFKSYAPVFESIFIAFLVALVLSFLELNRFMVSLVSWEWVALIFNMMILVSLIIFSGLVYAYTKQIKIPKKVVKILIIVALVMLFSPFLAMMIKSIQNVP